MTMTYNDMQNTAAAVQKLRLVGQRCFVVVGRGATDVKYSARSRQVRERKARKKKAKNNVTGAYIVKIASNRNRGRCNARGENEKNMRGWCGRREPGQPGLQPE